MTRKNRDVEVVFIKIDGLLIITLFEREKYYYEKNDI